MQTSLENFFFEKIKQKMKPSVYNVVYAYVLVHSVNARVNA